MEIHRHNPSRFKRLDSRVFPLACLLALFGCDQPRPAVTFPPNTLPVRYEPATSHTTCLVAAVAMAGNYLIGDRRMTEKSIREDMKAAGRDETKIEDIRTFLQDKGLYLLTLSGQLDGKPPSSLRYWLVERGYPVICVINRNGDDPAFNHAVVVTGIEHTDPEVSADKIVYLDPSVGQVLHTDDEKAFDVLWQRGERAMLIVVAPPRDSRPAGSTSKE
jgi:hypothetical protein